MGLKDLLLNKGWAGTTITRRETAERLDPILRQLYPLLFSYDQAIALLPGEAERLAGFRRTLSADIGKVTETILSSGVPAYRGSDPAPLPPAAAEIVRELRRREEELDRLLAAELKQDHHVRTRAILTVVRTNTAARLDHLRGSARSNR